MIPKIISAKASPKSAICLLPKMFNFISYMPPYYQYVAWYCWALQMTCWVNHSKNITNYIYPSLHFTNYSPCNLNSSLYNLKKNNIIVPFYLESRSTAVVFFEWHNLNSYRPEMEAQTISTDNSFLANSSCLLHYNKPDRNCDTLDFTSMDR